MTTETAASDKLAALSPEKRRLLERLLQKNPARSLRAHARTGQAGSVRVAVAGAQHRLWFLDLMEGGSTAYHIPLALRLQGDLDELALQAALDAVLRRHESLRTVFPQVSGAPVQEILAEARFALQRADLSNAEAERQTAQVQSQVRDELDTHFNLSVGPLIRGRLLRLSSSEHLLLIVVHHIVSDGWSNAVLVRELATLYSAYKHGESDPLPALPVQYADYAQWQHETSDDRLLQRLRYWQKHLHGAPATLELPTDRARPSVQSYRGATFSIAVGTELDAQLKSVSRRFDCTPAMIFFAAWSILLSRLSGQSDIVLGMPVANRRRAELEGLIGFFANTIAVRIRLDHDPSLADLMQWVKETLVTAYENQDVPFESVVAALQPERSLSHSPIFQAMFVFQNNLFARIQLPGLTVIEENVPLHTAKFDLTLSMQESIDGIVGSLNYAIDLFDEATIRRWASYFIGVLREIARDAHQKVSAIQFLSDEEGSQLLDSFNATALSYPRERLMHELFEEQVERTPHEVAVIGGGEHLTYRQLNCRANQLARYLRQQGAGPDRFVGLCVERGIEMVVGLLGILKSGGAYVPLDPNYPQHRLEYMLEDTTPIAVLTQEHLKDRLPAGQNIIGLDTQWSEIAQQAGTNPGRASLETSSSNLAYVIYTSGSTGRPKGVAIEHRNAVNMICWAQSAMSEEVFEQTLQSTSLNFDLSVYECFVPLVSGGSLRVVQNALALANEPHAQVTLINTVPSAIASLLDAGGVSASTRVVNLAGEALKKELVERIFAQTTVECVNNLYGPSETTTYSTWIAMPREAGFNATVGHPVANTQVYVLDAHRQLVPIGVVGEIYIGGDGVARGYLNRPELTAERFVSDPFSTAANARMYKTGDLGRWRADGTIEYLGRNDHQVKIRGFRIELGEIESRLVRHEQVKEAVVLAREDVPGEKRLVAYVVAHEPTQPPSVESLRTHVKETLPEHMVPSAFVLLERMPLTPNGKLDRRALPAPELGAYISREYEAPQGEVEEILAGIWQSLLRVERVGRQDNFFELGGHSLLIVQMMERLRRVGLSTELRRVFDSSSLAELASGLGIGANEQYAVPPNLIPEGCEAITPEMLPLVELEAKHIERIVQAVPGGAANVQDIYPLVPLQEGILFHHLFDDRGGDTYVLPMVLAVSSRARLDELIAALQAVIDRHDVLRTAVLWEELPRPVQVVYRRAVLPVSEVELQEGRSHEEQIQQWISPELQRLDLRQAPLLKLQISEDRGSGQWYVLLQLHHMTIDHVTLEIITGEIVAHLEGRAQGLSTSVPYRNHVARALAYARAPAAETFFRSKLSSVDESTAPFGLLDVHGDGGDIEEVREEIQSELAQRVRAQARRSGVSAATLFHAAWGLVVAHTSGRDDVVFGSVLLGRLYGVQHVLGMFINTLPIRLQLRYLSAQQLVEWTQRELVELVGHDQASLAIAQRCSSIVGSAPLFTALLNYRHSAPDAQMDWSSAEGVRVVVSQERTNYPVTLSVDDTGSGFALVAQTDRRIEPQRVASYLRTAVQSLIEALEQTPQTAALSLLVVPDEERRRMLETFNATALSYPRERLMHELFEEQVERTPHEVAVIGGGEHLTYRQLNCRANQLARYLRQQGAGPDRFVGLCVERGIEMVVGLLGILKSGGAYVPLDPNYPQHRLEYMLEDTTPIAVLTQEHLKDRLPAGQNIIGLDTQWSEIAQQAGTNPGRASLETSSSNLAYVIYTSGSTGRPKGVAIEHRNAVNMICWAQSAMSEEVFEQTLQSTSLNFDLSVYECFVPLVSGGSLRVVQNALALANEPHAQVTLINTVPSAIASLLDAGGVSASTRVVNLAGEALKKELVERIFAQTTVECVNNLYGPSETTTYSTWIAMPREAGFNATVGHPVANTQVYVLDAHRQLVPIGVVGEIYIGGDGVARGYLNRPELTAERFVSDPFSTAANARMYKTGDLGRWRADGTIEYLGRNDHQVKIRGFRIELGEIESRLVRHEQVKEAVVLAREDVPGEKRLVAYVVAHEPTQPPSVESLRTHVKETLPEHMVPSAFVLLERMPLTPNGKLDRRALPAPELGAYISREYEAPQGEVEEILAGIWQSLLRVERVGRQDNFFELGGHSLLIVQMMERLRRVGLSTELRRVFDSSSLAELASGLGIGANEQYAVPPNLIPEGCEAITPEMLPLVELEAKHIERIVQAVPGGAANVQDIYPLVPLQEGILFHHLFDDRGGDTYVLPMVLAVSSRARLDELIAALQAVIDRHDVLRTAVLWEELPRPVQVVYRRAVLPVSEVELQEGRSHEEQIQQWISPELQRLDLRQAPLLKLQISEDRGSGQWYVLLQLHHMTIDHVTLEIITGEIVAHLEGRAQGLSTSVPYRNHVAQALLYASRNDAEAFFRGKLQDVEEPSAPFGLLDVHGDGSQVEEAREELDASLAQRIRAQARRMSVSAATLFHAAWALVTAHTSGRDDVVFGSVLLGRMHGSAGAQRILGMFINTLPLRLMLRNVTAKELIEQTQRELVELLTYEQASLAAAQRCSGVVGSTPLFTTLLNYRHSVPNPDAEWSGARQIRVVAGHERTNYPITFSVDDLGSGFSLVTQTDHRINPVRVIRYLRAAVSALVEVLEQAPETAALSLAILPPEERHQLLEVFNATQLPYSQERLIHELFEEQVARARDACAIEYGQDLVTYAELNKRANRLARDLRVAGVRPDAIVGICLDRGVDMIVGVLATLKAGGAYLPLDPNYPRERLQYMMQDSAPRVVLIHDRLRKSLDLDLSDRIVLDPRSVQEVAGDERDVASCELALNPDHLIYLIYTSGSTGRPKGTGMSHRAMVNLIDWHRRSFAGEQACKVLQFAALSFDVAFQETFSTLCTGGTLVLVDEWVRRDARSLIELLAVKRVERLFVPPLMLQSLAECYCTSGAPSLGLRDIITAGEQLRISPEIVALFGHLCGCRLHNHYGPTETHVVTALTLVGDAQQWPSFPAIGAPIDNARIYILNQQQRPVPLGVVGEIYIGGVGIARGYLGRPELTQQRFLSDPFVRDANAKMYKTGDLGRWLSDGTIQYFGRNDDQVKLRGFRIEIGEIEAQIAAHESVKEATVLVREDVAGEKRLVAYVVPRELAKPPSAEELRTHAKRVLPEHMTPAAFVILDNLPLTPSGKLNRRALPAPEQGAYALRQYEAPEGDIEENLARIWQEVLKVQLVGRSDNFFELGGHSLLALKALMKINAYFGASLRVVDVYQNPVVRELAARLRLGAMQDDKFVDLATEATLDPQLRPCPGPVRTPARHVLLTGATGFVGRFLLVAILRSTTATVHCLVRDLQGRALSRLKESLLSWGLWADEFEHRIVVVQGDLKLPRLGIEAAIYEDLCQTLDALYHCATSMNHLETYAMAKPANVDAARELVGLAARHRLKVINYISTLGVFGSAANVPRRMVSEYSDIDHEAHRESQGYLASKWVGEKIFMNANARGIPCNIFRLGLVWADAARGRFDELQHAYRLLKSCLLSGYGIRDYRHPLPPVPVDYVVRAIVHLASRHAAGGGIFHVSSPRQKIEGMFERINEKLGASLKLLSRYDWISRMKHMYRGGKALPIVPLIEFAFSMSEAAFAEYERTVQTVSNIDVDCTRTHRELESAGIIAPQFDEELVGISLEDMLARDGELRQWAERGMVSMDEALLLSTPDLQMDQNGQPQNRLLLTRGADVASTRFRARSEA